MGPGGELLAAAIRTALGKRKDARALSIGTRPASDAHFFARLLEEDATSVFSLEDSFLDFLYGNWFISAVHERVSGQPGFMEVPGLVEPPVFGDAQGGVGWPFLLHVSLAGAAGGYLQDEVGRLSLLGDDVAVAVPVGLQVGVEGDKQVRGHPVFRWGPRFPGDVPLAGDDGGVGVAEVLHQVVDSSVPGQVAVPFPWAIVSSVDFVKTG